MGAGLCNDFCQLLNDAVTKKDGCSVMSFFPEKCQHHFLRFFFLSKKVTGVFSVCKNHNCSFMIARETKCKLTKNRQNKKIAPLVWAGHLSFRPKNQQLLGLDERCQ